MSWHYLPEGAEEYGQACYSDTLPFAPSKLSNLTGECSCSDRSTECFQDSRYGTTCEHLMEIYGEERLISSAEDSPARTLVAQEMAPVSTARAPVSGQNSPASFARYDPATHSLKTAQCSLFADLTECSPILPRWGSMRNGELSERTMSVHITSGKGFGLLPTLLTPNGGRTISHVTEWRGKTAYCNGKKVQVDLRAALLRLPTLTVFGNHNRKGASKTSSDGLSTALKKLEESDGSRGPLNPDWCEWFMGWPINATAFSPLEMAKFHEWQQQHGGF